ncbi:thioredoxin domain-containing protein [Paenibacillus sp. FA6]|uniref:thioredoxin domain-containing protein n=1 Tax=Paenibacillus sp. FA6 TaxID=3413029 RepID=UPI003F65CAD4
MRELNEQEVRSQMDSGGKPVALFLYTPLCGTCAATKRMLTVAEHLLPEGTISAANVNMMPLLAQDYKIRSVPAMLLMDADRNDPPNILYRMGSVEELLVAIRSVMK